MFRKEITLKREKRKGIRELSNRIDTTACNVDITKLQFLPIKFDHLQKRLTGVTRDIFVICSAFRFVEMFPCVLRLLERIVP